MKQTLNQHMNQLLITAQQGLEGIIFRKDSADDIHSASVDALFMWINWLCLFFFVMLMGLMVIFVMKYRRQPGKIAPKSASHNTILELTWTIVPLAILAVMFFQGFWGYVARAVAPGTAIQMNLTASKWVWDLEYPNGEITPESMALGSNLTVPIFYVPANVPVQFKMQSKDVMHSFWVPDFRSKFDVFPNRYTNYWFQAEAPPPDAKKLIHKDGQEYPYEDHWVFCAEYCGDKHSEMAAIIRVVPEASYKKVVFDEWGGAKPPVEVGRLVYKARCVSCHTVDGSKGTGPTWKDMYGHAVQFTDGTAFSEEQMSGLNFDNYVRESIIAPSTKVVQGYKNEMTSFAGMSENQINGVIAYIKSLSDKAPKEAPADGAPGTAPAPAPGTPAAPASAPAPKPH